jgi:hypothetical protein
MEPLCRADGTQILAVYQVPCAGCGSAVVPPVLSGYVDAVTGVFTAGALPAGAAPCACGSCDTIQLCDVTTTTTPGETPQRITNGTFATDTSGWTITGGATYVPSSSPDGSVGFLDLSPNNQAAGSATQTTSVTPGLTYNLSARIGVWSTGGTTPQSVRVDVLDGSGAVLYTQTVNPARVSGGPAWDADGIVGPVPIVATDNAMTVRFTDLAGGDFIDALLDDVSLLGPGVPGTTANASVPFLRTICRDCEGVARPPVDTTLDGTTPYLVQGTIGVCGPSADTTRQIIERCGCDDVNGDGSLINRYTELWTASDSGSAPVLIGTYLDGDFTQPYVPVNPIDCPAEADCLKCETQQLCDVGGPDHVDFPVGGPRNGTLANGVTWSTDGGGHPDGPDFWAIGLFPAPALGPVTFTFNKPVTLEFSGRVGRSYTGSANVTGSAQDGSLVMPPGTRLLSLAPLHHWDPATLTLTPLPGADSSFGQPVSRFAVDDPLTVAAWDTNGVTAGRTGLRWFGDITVTPAPVPFLRTNCRDCDGVSQAPVDTALDGITPYLVAGTATSGPCDVDERASCQDCETLILCDAAGDDPALISGAGISTATLTNGVTWASFGVLSTGARTPVQPEFSNTDGSWWGGVEPFPLIQVPPLVWTFSVPSTVEFSVYIGYEAAAAAPDDNCAFLPVGVEVVDLPTGYVFDPATGQLCVTADQPNPNDCAAYSNTDRSVSARFRTNGPVKELLVTPTVARHVVCGAFDSWRIGSFDVQPSGQFMRRICRDCDGATVSVTDTLLDGTTVYQPRGGVVMCDPEPACCQPVQVCVTPRQTGEVQFVSNPQKLDNGTVADTWTWTPVVGTDPSAIATWYPMYNKRYPGGAWAVTDAPTKSDGTLNTPTSGWISPHPSALVSNTGAAGEGPTIANPSNWWARAAFNLPAAADPDSIKVEITSLNADQFPVRYKLNNSPTWTAGGGGYTPATVRYTAPPATVPGAQAGANFLYFEVREDAPGTTPGANGAGVLVHMILTYEIAGQASWTRMVCCDGDTWYLDNFGERHESLPEGHAIVPCTQAVPLTLCDDNGTFIRWTQDLAGEVTVKDTTLNGAEYSPVGTVRNCASAATNADTVVSTGVRSITGTAVTDVKALHPGLQSVTLINTGTTAVNVTMTDGTAVPVPQGVTLTWSTEDDDDTSLQTASFAGSAAGSTYVLAFTWKATAAG